MQVHLITDTNSLRGVDKESAASVFHFEGVGEGKFRLRFDGEGEYPAMHITRNDKEDSDQRESIQVQVTGRPAVPEKPLTFTLDGGDIEKWKKGECDGRIMIVSDGGYLGYHDRHGVVEYFHGDVPRNVSVLFKLKKLPVGEDGKVQRGEPDEIGGRPPVKH